MILVTGAAGFIGSVIVKELNDRGAEDLILCDHFETGDKWKNLRNLKYDSLPCTLGSPFPPPTNPGYACYAPPWVPYALNYQNQNQNLFSLAFS